MTTPPGSAPPDPTRATGLDAAALKACCAGFYEQDVVALVLGDSYHPGGRRMTRRLANLLRLHRGQRVVDVASGTGETALLVAEEHGASVTGIDLGANNVVIARDRAREAGLHALVRFEVGDAEALPLEDATADALLCECALCTFPDKATAAHEFARVLRPGGHVGLSDVVVNAHRLDPALREAAAWMACIADARTAAGYLDLLANAGLHATHVERHDDALDALLELVLVRLRALATLDLPPIRDVDLGPVFRLLALARDAVADGDLGYVLIVGQRER